jgi:hypothetical protein
MFAGGGLGLPWREHWFKSALVVAFECLVVLWFFRRSQRMLAFRVLPNLRPSRTLALVRHPLILMPAIGFASVLLGAGVTVFLRPGGTGASVLHDPRLRNMGLSLLAAMAAYAVFAVIFVKKRGAALGPEACAGKLFWPLSRTLAVAAKRMAPTMIKTMAKSYEPFLQQTNLDANQQAQLEDLILKKQSVNWEYGLALMNPKLEPARRAALLEEWKRGREGCDAPIRQLLGEENHQAFERFEKTIPDRLVLGIFAKESAKAGLALSAGQQDQLLAAMTEARAQYHWTTDVGRRIQAPADLVAMFNDDNINTFAREEEEFDAHFLAQAASILTPEQLAALGPFQAKQRQAKVASMRMTARVLAPRSG